MEGSNLLHTMTRLCWSRKIKSVQKQEWVGRCVGSDISWWKLFEGARVSTCVPTTVVFFFHRWRFGIKKLPSIIVNNEIVLLNSPLKSDKEFSNSVLSWLRDLQATSIYPLQFCREASQIIHWLRFDNFTSSMFRASL